MGKIFKGITALVLAAAVMFTSASEVNAADDRIFKASLYDSANDVVISTDKNAINDELVQYGMYHGPFLYMFPIEYGPDLYFRKGETFKIETSYDKKYISKFWDDTTIEDQNNRHLVGPYHWEYNQVVSPGYLPKIDAGLTYTSSDTSVAKVTKKGKIKAVGYGNATVTVSVTNQDIISKVGEGMRKHLTFTLNVHVRKKKSIVKGRYCSDYTKEYIRSEKAARCWRIDYNDNFMYYYPHEKEYRNDCLKKSEYRKAAKKYKKHLNSLYGKWLDGIITTKEAENLFWEAKLYNNFSNCPDSYSRRYSMGYIIQRPIIKVIKMKKKDVEKLTDKKWLLGDSKLIQGKGYHNMRIYYDKKKKCYYAYLMETATGVTGCQLGERFFGFGRWYEHGSTDDEDEWHVRTAERNNYINNAIHDKMISTSCSFWNNDLDRKIVDRNGERIYIETDKDGNTYERAYVY